MHVAKFGRVSHLEMTHSVYLSPGELYVGFRCDATENVPSWFDWVWNIVWCNVDAHVSVKWHVRPTFYLICYPDFGIKMPTNLGTGFASEISHSYA